MFLGGHCRYLSGRITGNTFSQPVAPRAGKLLVDGIDERAWRRGVARGTILVDPI